MANMKGSTRRRVGIGASTVVAALAFGASPVSAHPTSINLGRDSASTDAGHTRIQVCNEERDGRAVTADVLTITGRRHGYTDASENGICSTFDLAPGAQQWRLCRISDTIMVCTSYGPV